MEKRICNKCKEMKELCEFGKKTANKDNLTKGKNNQLNL